MICSTNKKCWLYLQYSPAGGMSRPYYDNSPKNLSFLRNICQKKGKQYIAIGTVKIFMESSAKHFQLLQQGS